MQFLKKKGMLAVQTFFFIFMAIILVWILMFGFSKIFLVSKTLNDTELVLVKNDLEKLFNTCLNDPLKKGSLEYITIKTRNFNTLCTLSPNFSEAIYNMNPNLKEIFLSGDNVVLLKSILNSNGEIISIDNIMGSFNVDFNYSSSSCTGIKPGDKQIIIELEC